MSFIQLGRIQIDLQRPQIAGSYWQKRAKTSWTNPLRKRDLHSNFYGLFLKGLLESQLEQWQDTPVGWWLVRDDTKSFILSMGSSPIIIIYCPLKLDYQLQSIGIYCLWGMIRMIRIHCLQHCCNTARCPLNLWGKCAPPSSSNVSDVIMKRCGAFDEISRLWRLTLGISHDFPVKMAIYLYWRTESWDLPWFTCWRCEFEWICLKMGL